MIVSGSLELKDYMYEMRRCMRCASCKWLDHIYMPDNRFVYRCPSYAKYYFSKVAYGRLKLGLALTENRLEDTPGMKDTVFQCMMCGACDSGCKRNLDLEINNSLEALRGSMVEKGRFPQEHQRVIDNIANKQNKFGAPADRRQAWKPVNASAKSSTVYFVGCAASYIDNPIAQAADKILGKLGGYQLMPGEQCCGHPLFAMGHYEAFRQQMERNLEAMKATGATRLVTACAECYKTWKVDYPRMLQKNTVDMPFEVVHITELVSQALKDGSLSLSGRADLKVAWHDPCNLGRMSEPYTHWEGDRGQWGCLEPAQNFGAKHFNRGTEGTYEQPRQILEAIPGVELLELKRHHEFSWCCGGHGGVPEAYPELAAYAVDERLEEVKDCGAEAVVSACPYCKQQFAGGQKGRDHQVRVMDITELVASVL
ncbi:MAG: (Fe-S)-binding protein [Pseudomonadota bacterium]